MSVHITGPVWHLNLRTNRKMVLMKLADCANQHGANAFPSVDTISHDTGVSRRTVQAILAEFRASGVLVAERHELGGRGLSTVYMIDLERARALHPFSAAEPETKVSADAATKEKKGASLASFPPPSPSAKGASGDKKGARECTKGCESFAPEPRGTVSRNRQVASPVVPPTQIDDLTEAVNAYNKLADRIGLAKVQNFSAARRRKLRQRLAECGGLEGWSAALAKVQASSFLTGGGREGWRADFDFMIQAKSFTKIPEGAYDDNLRRGGAASEIQAAFDRMDAAVKGGAP